METKFTSGEWEQRDKSNKIFVKNTMNCIAIVCVQNSYKPITFEPIEDVEAIANAKLISAAPDMLEALKWALDEIKTLSKQIPVRFNVATNTGKKAWESHLNGMINIENSIKKATK